MAAFTEQQKTEFSMQKWYDLSGKTAVVTGGITGLGLAITRCLVSAGAKVIALSRTDEKKGNEILKEFGGKAVFYQFDITDTDHAQEIADRILVGTVPSVVVIPFVNASVPAVVRNTR